MKLLKVNWGGAYNYLIVFFIVLFFSMNSIKAAPNLKTELTKDASTNSEKCPLTISIQDNLKGNKDLDFSILDCIYYQKDADGKYLLDENGQKILKDKGDNIDFSCVQEFLDNYTNSEFKEAVNGVVAEGFVTNKYCPVYCVEENKFIFPGYAPIINSGAHFTWSIGKTDDKNIIEGLTVKLHGTKVCRSNVDLKKWVNDYYDIIEEIYSITLKKPSNPPANNCTDTKTCGGYKAKCTWKVSPTGTVAFQTNRTIGDRLNNLNKFESNEAWLNNFNNVFPTRYKELSHLTSSNLYYYLASFSMPTDTTVEGLDGSNTHFIVPSLNSDNGSDYEVVTAGAGWEHMAVRNDAESKLGSINQTVYVTEYERTCCHYEPTGTIAYNFPIRSYGRGYFLTTETWQTKAWEILNSYYSCDGSTKSGDRVSKNHHCNSRMVCPDGYSDYGNNSQCRKRSSSPNSDGVYTYTYKSKEEDWDIPILTTYDLKEYQAICGKGLDDELVDATAGIADMEAGSTQVCVSTGVRSCPSGFELAPDNYCYLKDTRKLQTLVTRLTSLIVDLKQCKKVFNDFDYYLETTMDIEYNDTSDSKQNFYLPSQVSDIDTELFMSHERRETSELILPSSKSSYTHTVNIDGKTYTFSANGIPFTLCNTVSLKKYCTTYVTTTLNNYWYDWYGKTYIAMYEYRLDGDFYRWVKLPSGESISTMPTGDYLKYGRFIDVGYANYPVHYSTPGGEYEGLNIKITNIGYKNYLYNTYQTTIRDYNNNLTDKDFVSTEGQNQLLHDCYYEVTEGEPYCPTKGCKEDKYELGSVRIIYRPISLENPFPAMDGQGRNTGSNWCTLKDDGSADCSNQNDNVEKYILNNRNIEGSSVYQKDEPMYQIELTPALINAIRDYNETTNYDDFNLSCSTVKGEEGTKCRSNFVVGVSDIDLTSFKDAISGCGTEEWNNCDTKDNYTR